jgi:two-component system, response regulator FlrC
MSGMGERILIVDDEEPMREIMAAILQHEGYECLCVPNGVDALKLLESGEKFDLITSDICNEPMWGETFINTVRQRYPDTPTLVVTGCRDIPGALHKGNNLEREQIVEVVRRFDVRRTLGAA